MNNNEKGNALFLYGIVAVTVLGGLLFGYDTAVISGAEQGLQAFFQRATDFVYTTGLHGITASSALIGCVIGGAISGWFAAGLGRRNSLRLAALLFFLSALGSWYPEFLFFDYGHPTEGLLWTFNAYRVIGGIGVGLASAICPMYIAEISPANLRGRLVSCNQFAIIFGMLVVYFVNYMIRESLPNAGAMVTEGWRLMFLSEAYPAAAFGLLLFLVPKTPRYLVMCDNHEAAVKVLERINGKTKAITILEEIKSTVKEKKEKLLTYGIGVIIIGILLSVFQQAVGINVVLYYAPRIFENMGASSDASMMQTVVMGIVNILFTLVAILTVDKWGRKPLLIVGSIGMMVGMTALSYLSFSNNIGITALIAMIVYTASFMMSWGPICWVLISEIFPNTIRGKAVAIAVAAQWIANFAVSSTFPSLSAWSIGGTYIIYAVFSLLSAIFVWKWVPETKGKTLEDMTNLWKKK
ncbi:MAG: D-xylose transporter XylE [Culturomica sp.]|jgi:SP family xylose:H+ symportor-like MFS transporter|nr:D-xylose transporter XylE [Culturomica sp.]